MNKVAIYPGTFDPITYGHIDVIKKSLKLFNKIVVGVSDVENQIISSRFVKEIVKLNGDIRKFTTKSTIKSLKDKYE